MTETTAATRQRIADSEFEVFPLCSAATSSAGPPTRPSPFAVLDAFIAGGGNFIDTADSYSPWVPGNSGGESETIIGRWIAARGYRDESSSRPR